MRKLTSAWASRTSRSAAGCKDAGLDPEAVRDLAPKPERQRRHSNRLALARRTPVTMRLRKRQGVRRHGHSGGGPLMARATNAKASCSARARSTSASSSFRRRREKMEETLWSSISRLAPLQPEFVSVTYGAGGSTRERTHATVARILRETELKPAAHLTCVDATKAEVDAVAQRLLGCGRSPYRGASRRSRRAAPARSTSRIPAAIRTRPISLPA